MEKSDLVKILFVIDQESKFSRERTKDELRMRVETWHHALKEYPFELVFNAAIQAVKESNQVTLHDVSKLISESLQDENAKISAVEAWRMTLESVSLFGYMREVDALNSLPDSVANAARAIGWRHICLGDTNGQNTLRAHFIKAFEAMQNREIKEAFRIGYTNEVKALTENILKKLPE